VVAVNAHGNVLLDRYVLPQEKVLDLRTRWSGIEWKHLQEGIAHPFRGVQKEVADIIKDRVVVGHALSNDLQCLLLSHPGSMIRDTAWYRPLQTKSKKPSKLQWLARKYLNVNIQSGAHDPAEDARAAMLLYQMFKKDWEASLSAKKFKRKKKKSKASDQPGESSTPAA